jgi:hypothetical protein
MNANINTFLLFLLVLIFGWMGHVLDKDLTAIRKDIVGEGMSVESTLQEIDHHLEETNRKLDVILAPTPAVRPQK